MNSAIVHGKILEKDGTLHPDFLERLKLARAIATQGAVSSILISGGVTREGYESEARVGDEYLQKNGISCPVRIEEASRTTKGNILACLEHIGETQGKVYVVCSSSSLERVKFLYEIYAPEHIQKLVFIPAESTFILLECIMNFPFFCWYS